MVLWRQKSQWSSNYQAGSMPAQQALKCQSLGISIWLLQTIATDTVWLDRQSVDFERGWGKMLRWHPYSSEYLDLHSVPWPGAAQMSVWEQACRLPGLSVYDIIIPLLTRLNRLVLVPPLWQEPGNRLEFQYRTLINRNQTKDSYLVKGILADPWRYPVLAWMPFLDSSNAGAMWIWINDTTGN